MHHTLFEFDKTINVPPEKLKGFKAYLDEIWQSRNQYKALDNEAEQADKQRFFSFDGNVLRARNYVGFVQYEGLRLSIYPKICIKIPNHQILPQILYWLSYSHRIHFLFANLPLDYQEFDDWLEAFVYLFACHTEEILSNQPYQSYQEITEEISYLRGRLATSDYIQNNLLTGRHQYFHCTYEPFLYDNQFNRIVKYVTKLLLSISTNDISQHRLNNLLFLLDGVSDEFCKASDCDAIKLNPLYQDLTTIIALCRMFLEASSISQADDSQSNFCFLLPMEIIFEDFIFGFIEKYFPDRNPKSQRETYLTINTDNKEVFKMKNDILLQNPPLIIDTKYKIREKIDAKKGISQADMYQMLAYAVKRRIARVLLIYPTMPQNLSEIDTFIIENNAFLNETIEIKAVDINICGIDRTNESQLVQTLFLYLHNLKSLLTIQSK